MACLLKNEPASHRARRGLTDGSQAATARASLNRARPVLARGEGVARGGPETG
jgi:hypothetical protein